MNKDLQSFLSFFPAKLEGLDQLLELALDLRWSWDRGADDIWMELDSYTWEMTHNPWVLLKIVSWEKLKKLLSDPHFRNKVDLLLNKQRLECTTEAWFQKNYPNSQLKSVAYFSMEYMLSEALPIYSGGLGNVAGDQLKSANDLGVPVIAIGLLYQQGYFRQIIDKDGKQQALYPYNEPGQLPILPLRKENGEWLRIEIPLPGWPLRLRVWQAIVGRTKLFLLDSNDISNYPAHRGITSELYGGGEELRLKQELILGAGGWRLLEAIGVKPDVCHLNEGHAAFVILERARSYMEETGHSFEVALAATRAGNLFTTHTAVPAGFDRFSPYLIEQYLGDYAKDDLKIGIQHLLALGRQNPDNPLESFNMAYLAIRGSGAVNGVSLLHEKVSKHLFASLFPRWPESEIPVSHVTNGVHIPSWSSSEANKLWLEKCGSSRWLGTVETIEADFRSVPDSALWHMRNEGRKDLVEFARKRLIRELELRGESKEHINEANKIFEPHTLTLGFARRFATYKRPNMLLQDPERLLRILTNPLRPVQLIIAGKAHPADKPGQDLIQAWMRFLKRPEARKHVIYIDDYDMFVSAQLTRGVDVWINTPRRPWEACGTSGMKVLANGGLNLSELDGWWAEAYQPNLGWAIGDGKEHGEDLAWDSIEADMLYDLLEQKVIPEFYRRDANGIPAEWTKRMRESMAQLTPRFAANRAVTEYTRTFYLPLAASYQERIKNNGEIAKQMAIWKASLKEHWDSIRFNAMKVETKDNHHCFEIQLYLDGIDPQSIHVELYAEQSNKEIVIQKMNLMKELEESPQTYLYQAIVPSAMPSTNFTPRVVPSFENVSIPLEADSILWYR